VRSSDIGGTNPEWSLGRASRPRTSTRRCHHHPITSPSPSPSPDCPGKPPRPSPSLCPPVCCDALRTWNQPAGLEPPDPLLRRGFRVIPGRPHSNSPTPPAARPPACPCPRVCLLSCAGLRLAGSHGTSSEVVATAEVRRFVCPLALPVHILTPRVCCAAGVATCWRAAGSAATPGSTPVAASRRKPQRRLTALDLAARRCLARSSRCRRRRQRRNLRRRRRCRLCLRRRRLRRHRLAPSLPPPEPTSARVASSVAIVAIAFATASPVASADAAASVGASVVVASAAAAAGILAQARSFRPPLICSL